MYLEVYQYCVQSWNVPKTWPMKCTLLLYTTAWFLTFKHTTNIENSAFQIAESKSDKNRSHDFYCNQVPLRSLSIHLSYRIQKETTVHKNKESL